MSEPVLTEPVIALPVAPAAVAVPLPAAEEAPLFTQQEILQLDADDSDAGRSLGKMLGSFFLYTVLVMLIVAWWTVRRNHLETRLGAERFGGPAAAVQEKGSDASTAQPSKTGENAQE
jgi:hypothetical protein